MESSIVQIFQSSQEYIKEYGHLAVFILLFLETTLFIGAVIPGVIVLVLAGYLCFAGTLSPYLVLLFAFFGTLAGDNFSYAIGHLFGKKYLKFPDSIQKSAQKNWWVLLFFHHVPLSRMFIPAFFGTNRLLTYRFWLILDTFSSLVFVITYFSIGYIAHKVTLSVEKVYSKANSIIIIVCLMLLIAWIVKFLKDKKAISATTETEEEIEQEEITSMPVNHLNATTGNQVAADKIAKKQVAGHEHTGDRAALDQISKDFIARNKTTKNQTTTDPVSKDQVAENMTAGDRAALDQISKDFIARNKTTENQTATDPVSKDQVAENMTAEDRAALDQISKDFTAKNKTTGNQTETDPVSKDQVAENMTVEDRAALDQISKDFTVKNKTTGNQTETDPVSKDQVAENESTGNQRAVDEISEDLAEKNETETQTTMDRIAKDFLARNKMTNDQTAQDEISKSQSVGDESPENKPREN